MKKQLMTIVACLAVVGVQAANYTSSWEGVEIDAALDDATGAVSRVSDNWSSVSNAAVSAVPDATVSSSAVGMESSGEPLCFIDLNEAASGQTALGSAGNMTFTAPGGFAFNFSGGYLFAPASTNDNATDVMNVSGNDDRYLYATGTTNKTLIDAAISANGFTAMSRHTTTNAQHYLITGQSFAVGAVEDGYGDLLGEYKTGMANCYQNAATYASGTNIPKVVQQNYTGDLYIQNYSNWSVEIALASILRDTLAQDIYITRCAHSGAAITEWVAGNAYEMFLETTNEVAATISNWSDCPDPSVLIWMQGENECDDAAKSAAYYSNLNTVMAQYRAVWPDIRVIIAGQNYYYSTNTSYFSVVQDAKRQFCAENDWAFYVDCIDTSYGVGHHPDSLGNLQMGAKFAASIHGLTSTLTTTNGLYAETVRGEFVGADKLAANTISSKSLSVIGDTKLGMTDVVGALSIRGIDQASISKVSADDLDTVMYWVHQDGSAIEAYTNTTLAGGSCVTLDVGGPRGEIHSDSQYRNSSTAELADIVDGTYTIVCWVRNDGVSTANHAPWGLKHSVSGESLVFAFNDTATTSPLLVAWGGATGNWRGSANYTSDLSYDISEWVQVALSYDSGTSNLNIYVNGEHIDLIESVVTGTPVGYIYNGYASSWTGSHNLELDDMQLYGRVLTAEEISSLYAFQKDGDFGLFDLDYALLTSTEYIILSDASTNATVTIINGKITKWE